MVVLICYNFRHVCLHHLCFDIPCAENTQRVVWADHFGTSLVERLAMTRIVCTFQTRHRVGCGPSAREAARIEDSGSRRIPSYLLPRGKLVQANAFRQRVITAKIDPLPFRPGSDSELVKAVAFV